MEMVQGRQILIFYTIIGHIANDCGYKILHFWANPQKYQTLVPAKNSHLKVLGALYDCKSTLAVRACNCFRLAKSVISLIPNPTFNSICKPPNSIGHDFVISDL